MSNQIVGSYKNVSDGLTYGFIYDGQDYTTGLILEGAQQFFLRGINDQGQMVGSYSYDSLLKESQHGFIYEQGTFTTIDFSNIDWTSLWDINNDEFITGRYKVNPENIIGQEALIGVPVPEISSFVLTSILFLLIFRKFRLSS